MYPPLPVSFFRSPDVLSIAKNLLGKALFTCIDGQLTGGLIIETEGYAGAIDRASHSYNYRRTARTEALYREGGIAYVYLCYGIHHLLNTVVSCEGDPQGVLIRAIDPRWGIETMLKRRSKKRLDRTLTNGPGALTAALGVTLKQYAIPLNSSQLWIADAGIDIQPHEIIAGPRIGVDYAGEDALLPYRFLLKTSDLFCNL